MECVYTGYLCIRMCVTFFKCIVNAFSPSISFAIEFGIIFHFSCASCRGHKWPEWRPNVGARTLEKIPGQGVVDGSGKW